MRPETVFGQGRLPDEAPRLLSHSPVGQPGRGASSSPTLSMDGRFIAFASWADNLLPGDSNLAQDIFLFDQNSGTLTLISQAGGIAGNASSYQAVISADGSSIAFASLAANLAENDANGLADIYVYERSTGRIERISNAPDGAAGNGWSDQPTISGDGRYVAFISSAENLVDGDHDGATNVFVYDRRLGRMRRISGIGENASQPAISQDGRYVAYLSNGQEGTSVRVFDLLSGEEKRLPNPIGGDGVSYGPPAISGDGGFVAYIAATDKMSGVFLYQRKEQRTRRLAILSGRETGRLSISADGRLVVSQDGGKVALLDQVSGKIRRISATGGLSALDQAALSGDGQWLAYMGRQGEVWQVFATRLDERIPSSAPLSGWVSDGWGHPMAGVKISDSSGQTVITSADGNFTLPALPGRGYLLSPAKKGYAFSPTNLSVMGAPGGRFGLAFSATAESIVEEGRKDIGMPYALHRGCESPLKGCGGPFHGFYSGDCTDLVMDAYLEAVDLNIQIALERDFHYNPNHYYRWRNARSAEDMWRYFVYSGQMLSADQPYALGDIVFFDWQDDGVIDHVALISEVSSRGRPRKMIDATGKIEENPSGLAAELPWKPYHAAHTPGHARWLGYTPKSELEAGTPILIVNLDAPKVSLRLLDRQGRAISLHEGSIPGATAMNTGVGTLISVGKPWQQSEWYFAELSSPVAASFQLGIQTVQSGQVSAHQSIIRQIPAGGKVMIAIHLKMAGGKLTFELP